MKLLFSHKGRIGRRAFFFTQLGLFAFIGGLILLVFVSLVPGGSSFQALTASTGFIILLVCAVLINMWAQTALFWKRNRDFSDSYTLCYIYFGSLLLSSIPVIGILGSIIAIGLAIAFCCIPPKDQNRHAVSADVFGLPGQSGEDELNPVASFADNLSDADLVKRAEELRQSQAPKTVKAPETTSRNPPRGGALRPAQQGFGRRQNPARA